MKYWEIIARNIKKRGWSLGWISTIDSQGRTIWIVDAHRGDGKRFVARADEKLTAFVELELAVQAAKTEIKELAGWPATIEAIRQWRARVVKKF